MSKHKCFVLINNLIPSLPLTSRKDSFPPPKKKTQLFFKETSLIASRQQCGKTNVSNNIPIYPNWYHIDLWSNCSSPRSSYPIPQSLIFITQPASHIDAGFLNFSKRYMDPALYEKPLHLVRKGIVRTEFLPKGVILDIYHIESPWWSGWRVILLQDV